LNAEEVAALQLKNLRAMAQAQRTQLDWCAFANAFTRPEKPLDERFADLKIRLEAAIDRQKAKKSAINA